MSGVEFEGIVDPFPDTTGTEMAVQEFRNMLAERTGGLDLETTYQRIIDMHGGDEEAANLTMQEWFGDLTDGPPPGARPDERGSLPDIVDRIDE